MAASAEEIVAMNAKDAEVRTALEKAEADATGTLAEDGLLSAAIGFLSPIASIVTGAAGNDAQDAVLANLRTVRERYENWSDASSEDGKRLWAERGTEPDGFPYAVSFWLQQGDDLLSELGQQTKYLDQSSDTGVVSGALAQTAKDLKGLFDGHLPDGWPPGLKDWVKKIALVAGGTAAAGLLLFAAVQAWPWVAALRRKKEG